MFLSPSLKNIWDTGQRWFGDSLAQYDRLEPEQALELLDRAASICPNLKSLDLYPSPLPSNKHLDTPHIFFTSFCRSIQSFACLRELSINSILLERRSFLSLGRLPALESLAIYPCAYDENVSDLTLPEDAFPALRRLDLQMMNSDSVTQLCELKPLVQGLTTLGILPQPNNIYPVPPNLCLARAIFALATNNLSLSSILIGDQPYYSATAVEIDTTLLQQFQKFSLKRLALSVHILSTELTLQSLLEVLPAIEELSLEQDGYCAITLEQLRGFASCTKLPNLRSLTVSVDFKSAAKLSEADFDIPQNQSLVSLKLQSGFNQVGKNKRLAKLVAR